jgi:hypothetical protein
MPLFSRVGLSQSVNNSLNAEGFGGHAVLVSLELSNVTHEIVIGSGASLNPMQQSSKGPVYLSDDMDTSDWSISERPSDLASFSRQSEMKVFFMSHIYFLLKTFHKVFLIFLFLQ